MDSTTLGALVRRVRRRQQLTQQALAAAADVSTRFVHDLEHGKSTAALGLTLRVLAALGIEVQLVAPDGGDDVTP
ncbi:transcriptional regulator [Isoalcanivorax pacificus W11-5]|uniref:Transcriptional regulator n=1 Tax=Isoalcanivorax pacificus W11-5 TaxID=391936 RepID=A0A0B4XKY4_9GAMM|nr:helix-turn-helix domain-containing protein [Isoalcanivorax pacificus]AJD48924.1 transcriptional regulator [Isoalcanivorax pacificus W11-5]